MTCFPKTLSLRKELTRIKTGYGLMSLTWRATPIPELQAFKVMKRVVEIAQTNGHKAFFNVGEFYGPNFVNLSYVKDFFQEYPDLRKDVIISCKGAFDVSTMRATGKHDDVIKSVERCVAEIGGFIDLFEVARLDQSLCAADEVYPYESFEALAEMVDNGVIGAISLSEVTAPQIRAIHEDWGKYLVCVEVELSLFTTGILNDGVAKANNDLNLVTVAYSPLGRGLLTGALTSRSDIPKGDFRLMLQRFSNDSLSQNLLLAQFLKEEIADKRPKDDVISLPQVALGWIKHWNKEKQFANTYFLPIPSGSSVEKVEENFDEAKAQITDAEFTKINDFLKDFEIAGGRFEIARQ